MAGSSGGLDAHGVAATRNNMELNDMRRSRTRSVTAAIGGAFVASLAFPSVADTSANPFGAEVLPQGYELLADAHGKGDKDAEGKCGEGKCCGKCKKGEVAKTETPAAKPEQPVEAPAKP